MMDVLRRELVQTKFSGSGSGSESVSGSAFRIDEVSPTFPKTDSDTDSDPDPDSSYRSRPKTFESCIPNRRGLSLHHSTFIIQHSAVRFRR